MSPTNLTLTLGIFVRKRAAAAIMSWKALFGAIRPTKSIVGSSEGFTTDNGLLIRMGSGTTDVLVSPSLFSVDAL